MSLYLKHRPNNFNEILGNQETVSSLEGMVSDPETCPHVFLFHGNTGCGKTTLARIVGKELGIVGQDLREMDSADFRGIDSVREIRKQAQYKPLEGSRRMWILDECFAPDTLVTMIDGDQKPIKDVKPGEDVQNLYGFGVVTNHFKNKVLLNRVLKITFLNGCELICSEDHEFMTPDGWVKAKNLKNSFVYKSINSKLVQPVNLLNTLSHENLYSVQNKIKNESEEILLNPVPKQEQFNTRPSNSQVPFFDMPNMQEKIYSEDQLTKTNLWESLWEYISRAKKGRDDSFEGNSGEIIKSTKTSQQNKSWQNTCSKKLKKNVEKQPNEQSKDYRKNEAHKTDQWNFTCLVRGTWWKWQINKTTKIISSLFGVENGNSNLNWTQFLRQFRIPKQLQSRCRERGIEVSHRSGWQGSSDEKSQIERLEKGEEIEPLRVDGITFYQRGNNDESFNGVIGDKEKNQGYVEFHDLEISNHHSYYANGVAVHNCHKLTNDAQNALLKILEDTPSHVYFVLCTTDPQKLLKTIRSRCSQFEVKPLSDREMKNLLLAVCKAEKKKISGKVGKQIIQDSQGHPRAALQILDQVLRVSPKKQLQVAKRSAEQQNQSIELCRALLKGEPWSKVSNILKGLKDEDPESIRRHVLGYTQAVLLNGDNPTAGLIMECMQSPFYDTGFAGLIFECYSISKS